MNNKNNHLENEENEENKEKMDIDFLDDLNSEDELLAAENEKLKYKIQEVKDAINKGYIRPSGSKERYIDIIDGPCPDLWTEDEMKQYEKEVNIRREKLNDRQLEMRKFKIKLAETTLDMIRSVIECEYDEGDSPIYVYNKIRKVVNQIGDIDMKDVDNF